MDCNNCPYKDTITRLEKDIRTNNDRIITIEQDKKAQEVQYNHILDQLKSMQQDLREIKDLRAVKFDKITMLIIGAIVTGIATFIFKNILN